MDSLCLAHGKHLINLQFRIINLSELLSTFWGKTWPVIDTTCECCPALKFLLIFGLIKSLDPLEFDHFKFQGQNESTIETKCYHALLCLKTFGLIKISDQCDFDHFKFQIPLLPQHFGTKI